MAFSLPTLPGPFDSLPTLTNAKSTVASAKSTISSVKSLGSNALKAGATAIATAALGPVGLVGGTLVSGIVPGIGGNNECAPLDFICELKKWITDQHFFSRTALVIVGFILLLMAFYLLGKDTITRTVKDAIT